MTGTGSRGTQTSDNGNPRPVRAILARGYKKKERPPSLREVTRLVQQAKSGATRRFWIKDGLLITRGNCLYVLKVGKEGDLLSESAMRLVTHRGHGPL